MKNNNLKIWSAIYLLFFVLFTGTLFAQNAYNISGTFEGLRSQFNKNHTAFSNEFQYKYELTQKGNLVEGVSTIISEEGNFAEVGIRGVVIKDKFYFEEFSLLDQIKAPSMVWCYKTGVLTISQKGNIINLSGETQSYMIGYNVSCSGGFTKLAAIVENTEDISFKNGIENIEFEFNLFPNPTSEKINFTFNNISSKTITVEIFDLSGKSLIGNKTRKISSGNFSEFINVQKLGLTAGLYIFKMTLDDTVYTKEFIVSTK